MSRSASDVSVVTVNWNGKDHLEALLPSLVVLEPREIIVVDNGSSDGSQDFVRARYPGVRIVQNETNQGFAQPNNLGAEVAQGRYLALINNDMRVDPGWIEAALARLKKTVVCVGSQILDWSGEKIDFNGSSLEYLGYALQQNIGEPWRSVSSPDRILFACGGAMLIERDVFRRVGGFDEDYFAIYEDVDLGWRLWLAGYDVAFAPDSIAFHRGHGTLGAHANEKMRYLMHRNALLTVLKNYEEPAFRKVFPLAIVLAIKRAVLFSGVDKERFYLWSKSRERLEHSDRSAFLQILDSLNHLVAVDDILDRLPQLLEKRSRVQALRRRRDADIFPLFVDPFRPIVENNEYLRVEKSDLEMLGLTSLFEPLTCPEAPHSWLTDLEQEAALLRRELTGLQWLETHAVLRPPVLTRPGLRQFIGVWRREGLRAAWRRFVEHVERGI
jgi:GT2 family glycosyltransferase